MCETGFECVPRWCFFCGSVLLFMFRVCHAFLSVHCSLVVTCWERANLLVFLCVVFYCVFVTFPCGALGQVRYLIVSISDLCLVPVILTFICGIVPRKIYWVFCHFRRLLAKSSGRNTLFLRKLSALCLISMFVKRI